MFAQLDADGSGSIDQDELSALTGSSESASLFGELDSDADGGLNIDELAALAPPPPPRDAGNAEALFGQLDADGSGSLDQDELGSLLDYVGQAAGSRSSEEENESGLIAKLLAQYQSSASYQSSIGTQLNLSA